MNAIVASTHTNDSAQLRQYIAHYTVSNTTSATALQPMSTLMGVKNPDFARMLCPIEAVREYDKDPTVHVVYPIIAIFPLMLPQDEKPT